MRGHVNCPSNNSLKNRYINSKSTITPRAQLYPIVHAYSDVINLFRI